MEQLKQQLFGELDIPHILETVNHFNGLFRYSGTKQGEAAVSYIEKKLKEAEVPFEHCEYDGFFSIPKEAALSVNGEEIRLVGDVYSAEAESITGELCYDAASLKKGLTELEQAARFALFKDKLVLTWEGGGPFARRAMEAGALGVIHICATKGPYIHHSNIGVAWGTPGFDEEPYMRFLPSAGIARADAENLIDMQKPGRLTASLTIHMDTQIRRSSMVIAEIPGSLDSFILVSGHYDSWYEGITDNAISDAILLEYARIFWKHRARLRRGIRIAWWSGHSDGRFSGSAWYCDGHFSELRAHCVAHINLDLAGCKNADQIAVRTAGTEGLAYTGRLIKKYTGKTPAAYIPMIRGADQSFWGAYIPITIMLKYEPLPENRLSDCPSGGPWWHTPEDTIDKLDEKILIRDAKINLELILDLQGTAQLPIALSEFTADMSTRLSAALDSLPEEFDGTEIRLTWQELIKRLIWLAGHMAQNTCSDADLKYIAGKLLHLIYCRRSPYVHDFGEAFGIFGSIKRFTGMTAENTPKPHYTIAKTEFLRNKNRLCTGFREITHYIDKIQK